MSDVAKTRPPAKVPPHRFRFNVPRADDSVVRWVALQDLSVSLCQLVHESIERSGYFDVFNKPVAQSFKRGRPAGGPGFQRPTTRAGTRHSPLRRLSSRQRELLL